MVIEGSLRTHGSGLTNGRSAREITITRTPPVSSGLVATRIVKASVERTPRMGLFGCAFRPLAYGDRRLVANTRQWFDKRAFRPRDNNNTHPTRVVRLSG
jgi:hypothetical protein